MDVLFVNSVDFSTPSPNKGQLILKKILSNRYEVECVNFDFLNSTKALEFKETITDNINMFGEYILDYNPRIVGFYTICNSFALTVQLASYIKGKRPDIIIIFGGPHATLVSEKCMNYFEFVDVICLGESEKSIMPLVDAFLSDGNIAEVPGITYKNNQKVIKNPNAPLLSNQELVDYAVYDYSPFTINKGNSFQIEGGRGCPFGCTFCSTNLFWERKYRVKPVDSLINEMKQLNSLYGVKGFDIEHDLFTADREYFKEFCLRIINEKSPYILTCSSRVDVLDEEVIQLMKKANFYGVYLGIESGSERMQKILNKNLKLDKAIKVIKYMNELNINLTVSFIYCFPDETIEDFKETIKMIETILLLNVKNVQLHRYIPLPSTEETEKVKNRLYFDKSVIDTSIYSEKLLSEESNLLIQKYPEVFTQYYTFDSEVKSRYMRFDSMIITFSCISNFYLYSLRFLVRKYGLEGFYFKYEKEIDEMYYINQKISLSKRTSQDITKMYSEVFDMYNTIFAEEIKSEENFYFSEIYKYDHLKYCYHISGKKESEVHEFDMDIEYAMKTGIYKMEKYYVRIFKNGNKISTKKVSPLYGVIKAIEDSKTA